jgi:hypothetical protein
VVAGAGWQDPSLGDTSLPPAALASASLSVSRTSEQMDDLVRFWKGKKAKKKRTEVCREIFAVSLMARELREKFLSRCAEKSPLPGGGM